MKKAVAHLRANVVAYLALSVALGGTSYAAISIPANSVGSRQLRNGAVTGKKLASGSIDPSKFAKALIAGSIRAWAIVGPSGVVVASSEPVSEVQWSDGGGPQGYGGFLVFAHAFAAHGTACFATGGDIAPGGILQPFTDAAPGTATVDAVNIVTRQFNGLIGYPTAFSFWVMVVCAP